MVNIKNTNELLDFTNTEENLGESINTNKSEKRGMVINIGIILVIFVCLFMYMAKVDGIDNIVNLIANANPFWVLIGFICIIMFWILEAVCLHIPLKNMYKTQKFSNTFKISMIGQLFNNITPFSSGRATNASIRNDKRWQKNKRFTIYPYG